MSSNALLSPNIELGLRYDGGDAETGVGPEWTGASIGRGGVNRQSGQFS